MNYLRTVFNQLRKVQWARINVAALDTVLCIIAILMIAAIFYGIDMSVNEFVQKIL
ncbi:preprotein translocase subunit SecE (plasmid) [Limosilactobacillus reuteri]|uniref:preprotein translocase subunit SecE n=1 Tax=Limosilactobacillus reuteri TaxID=1598 RepID=UPI0039BFE35D